MIPPVSSMKVFGLIGYPLLHSWSQDFFTCKFRQEHMPDYSYQLFPLPELSGFNEILEKNPALMGLNVTIPYKIRIISFLDHLDSQALQIGAVNTIRIGVIQGKRYLEGFNTDADAFRLSANFSGHSHALVLGTGGAAKAVCFTLKQLGITYRLVSRDPLEPDILTYQAINPEIMQTHRLIINATPLGMFPESGSYPPIPYEQIRPGHFLYDLIYNPLETLFLKKGAERGARIQSGIRMLYLQAERSFAIFTGQEAGI